MQILVEDFDTMCLTTELRFCFQKTDDNQSLQEAVEKLMEEVKSGKNLTDNPSMYKKLYFTNS